MSRTLNISRISPSGRDLLIPESYNVAQFGDSYSDDDGGQGTIGRGLGLFTSQGYSLIDHSVAGDNLADIRTRFEAEFATLPDHVNTIILQGSINNIANAGKRTTFAQMQIDMSAMADVVIADGRYFLIIIAPGPWMGHDEWTEALQTQTTDYDTWGKAKYANHWVSGYDALGDPAEPRQKADWAYKGAILIDSRDDVHPNKCADRYMEQKTGELLFTRTNTPLSEPAGNILSTYRDMTGWTPSGSSLGGNTILLADGTEGNNKGILSVIDTLSIKKMIKNTTLSPPVNADIEWKFLMHSGVQDWAWLQYKDSNSVNSQAYIDIIGMGVGGTTGTAIWKVTKAENGWVWVTCNVTNSALGTNLNNLEIRPALSDGNIATDPYNRSVDAYPPEIYFDATSIVIL